MKGKGELDSGEGEQTEPERVQDEITDDMVVDLASHGGRNSPNSSHKGFGFPPTLCCWIPNLTSRGMTSSFEPGMCLRLEWGAGP